MTHALRSSCAALAGRATLALCSAVLALPLCAQDRAAIDPTQIIGNRELPKVLYIISWKKPAPGDLAGRPTMSVLDEALAPLDRDVFRRQLRYDAQVQARAPSAPARLPATQSEPSAPAQ
ncbi:MAG: hypothetical protein WA210_02310 [Burkholderiaceae bacterium]